MRLPQDQAAVSPVIATVLMVAIVVVAGGTVFFLTNGFPDDSPELGLHVALVTDNGASTTSQWRMSFQSALPPRDLDQFLFVLRTPQNGTLVADPSAQPTADTMDFYWQLGPSADKGRHVDNGTTVGVEGKGGFHLRLIDVNADGRVGGGDQIFIWYDGDGDQAHQTGPDEPWPAGSYTFEVKHQRADKYVALELREF